MAHGTVVPMRTTVRLLVLLTMFCAIAGYALFGYFEVHTYFREVRVFEPEPVFASRTMTGNTTTVSPVDGDTVATRGAEDAKGVKTGEPGLPTAQLRGEEEHIGRGTVTIHADGDSIRILRLEEDFQVENGPDLHVLLGNPQSGFNDDAAWIDLGTLKGNIGSQNYRLPRYHPVTNVPVEFSTFTTLAIRSVRFDDTYALAYLADVTTTTSP